MIQSYAQTEYSNESPITHDHLTLVRPNALFRLVDGSKTIEQQIFNFRYQCLPLKDFFLEPLCPAQTLIQQMLERKPRLSHKKSSALKTVDN